MQRITFQELQKNFEEIMDSVEYGNSFIITMDGEEKAVLLPYEEYKDILTEINSYCDEENYDWDLPCMWWKKVFKILC